MSEKDETKEWLKDKLTLTLTRKEFINLSNVFHSADFNESDFYFIKNKKFEKIKRLFEKENRKRHKLWLKIIRVAEGR